MERNVGNDNCRMENFIASHTCTSVITVERDSSCYQYEVRTVCYIYMNHVKHKIILEHGANSGLDYYYLLNVLLCQFSHNLYFNYSVKNVAPSFNREIRFVFY